MPLTEADLRLCYEIVFGRAADEAGLAHNLHVAKANGIKSLHDMARLFYESEEFRSRFGMSHLPDVFDRLIQISYEGLTIQLPEGDAICREITRTGTYEPYLSKHLFSQIRPGETFIDVGANVGVICLPVAKRVGPNGRVMAFEVSPRNANLLMRNAIDNQLANVEVYPIGLADRNGSVLSPLWLHTTNMALVDQPSSSMGRDMEVVPVVKLDSFLDRNVKVDAMKVDVEGFEYKVFGGAIDTLSRWKPRLYTEYSDAFQRARSGVPGAKLLELLIGLGYCATILHREQPPEAVAGSPAQVIDRLDSAWRQWVAGGGTHLDLYWS